MTSEELPPEVGALLASLTELTPSNEVDGSMDLAISVLRGASVFAA